jgi:anti-anti-sigma factor
MEIKIDTKEKFTVLTPVVPEIADNISALTEKCEALLQGDVKNLILNLRPVTSISETAANAIANLQQQFYEQNASFVICELKEDVEAAFEKADLLDGLNYTPSESEAWDIVQMEEIERELMDDDNPMFNDFEDK